MSSERTKIPAETQREVLLRSRRRCCLCYGLSGNFDERIGQVAHIDQRASNSALDNLAWLCFDHHSLFDSSTRQHKNYQADELKAYRDKLYRAIATSSLLGPESLGEYISTDKSSHVIRLPDRVIVIFDWPMRCTPTLYFSPQNLLDQMHGRLEQWTRRGFQVTFSQPVELRKFAFFADASPSEYSVLAKEELTEWRANSG